MQNVSFSYSTFLEFWRPNYMSPKSAYWPKISSRSVPVWTFFMRPTKLLTWTNFDLNTVVLAEILKENLGKNSHRNVAKLFSISRLKIVLSLTFEKLVKSYIYWAAKRSLKEGRPYWRKNSTLFSAYINMIYQLEKSLFP